MISGPQPGALDIGQCSLTYLSREEILVDILSVLAGEK
jgi:hypothetical protein